MQWSKAVCLLVCVLGIVLLGDGNALAERRYDTHGDVIALGAEEFTGVVEGIREKQPGSSQIIVINDSVYTIDKEAVFRTRSGGPTSVAYFKTGMAVKFYALGSVLTKMWEVTEQGPSVGQEPVPATQQKNVVPFRQEGGVWKN
ncbi:hypothetical protein Despr_2072 [Desulfobulbus propionicus DSM 2032]|uniref:Uncharacterized protein n=1 Tax=Desulfobulbus propionicus (strain ATCC 33891 / DSM 2032 / VKM B-1956 / 1pr3) TaxID=577650 RepID=A0A7U3YMS0_DESPD|nr:hypothetical protein [Desulfobulbus propionicus]ADW18220.1 hypothetical protein Despr_2072 [Desulfobulbus propionicus DSM 2032]